MSRKPPRFFLVIVPEGTPEDMKERIVMKALDQADIPQDQRVTLGRVSPRGWVSGMSGEDMSLIPRLKGKTLALPNGPFHTKHPERTRVLGILREAYDGTVHSEFKNGVTRHYEDVDFRCVMIVDSLADAQDIMTVMGKRVVVLDASD